METLGDWEALALAAGWPAAHIDDLAERLARHPEQDVVAVSAHGIRIRVRRGREPGDLVCYLIEHLDPSDGACFAAARREGTGDDGTW